MDGPVVVVGDACLDVAARLSEPLRPGSDTAAAVINRPGGSGANVAAWLAGTGVPVRFVGRVGDDETGRLQVSALQAAGVDVEVAVDPAAATGTVIALVGEAGERSMVTDRGASGGLQSSDLPASWFAAGAHLHLSGYVLLHDGSRPAGLAALAMARDAGMTTSVDASSSEPLRVAGARAFLGWTAGVSLLFANTDEAQVLAGSADAASQASALARHYGEVVLKMGAGGARWRGAAGSVAVEAQPAAVVDTTGAGDAFAAGFLAAWGRGASPEDALLTGARLAAVAVGAPGARPVPGSRLARGSAETRDEGRA